MLIKLDFPTFDRPINAYSAFVSSGHFVTFGDEIVNSDFFIIIFRVYLFIAKLLKRKEVRIGS